MTHALKPARLSPGRPARRCGQGLRARRARVVLSALGIAIGIATMVAVVGLSESSRADLMSRLDRLGTNLLTAEAGDTPLGGTVELPKNAVAMVERIGPVLRTPRPRPRSTPVSAAAMSSPRSAPPGSPRRRPGRICSPRSAARSPGAPG